MYKIESTISFEAAHRLYDVETYSEECRDNIHGHSYKVTVVIGRQTLNDASMVIDFKLFKKIVNVNIHDVYDHSCIIRDCDPLCKPLLDNCKKVVVVQDNPTAEWMAKTFYRIIRDAAVSVDRQLEVIRVDVQETENNIASYCG